MYRYSHIGTYIYTIQTNTYILFNYKYNRFLILQGSTYYNKIKIGRALNGDTDSRDMNEGTSLEF